MIKTGKYINRMKMGWNHRAAGPQPKMNYNPLAPFIKGEFGVSIPLYQEAIHMVASLGGFLGRKNDGEPGTQTLWLGLQRLDDITEMWKISIAHFAPYLYRSPPVSSKKCG